MSSQSDNVPFFRMQLVVAIMLASSFAQAQMSQSADSANCKDLPPALDQESLKRNPVRPVPTDIVHTYHRGTVVLHLQIDESGSLKHVEISKSSSYHQLDQMAMALSKRWRYLPAKHCGMPIDGVFDLPVTFPLPGDVADDGVRGIQPARAQ
ncbi:energy transducer TonB [Rudaea sp.]|uniref:energy transducer TonB n=1 Tax=Rudaea sp. TaxID=2136325 RepID=UPI003220645E